MAEADAEDKTSVNTEEDTSTKDSGTKPEKPADAPDDSAKSAAGDEGGAKEDKGDGQSEDEADDSEAKKQRNREEYKLRVAQRESKEVTQMRQNLDAWVNEAEDDTERRTRAVEAKQYLSEVKGAQDEIARDNEQVAREIPIFNAASPEFRQDLLDRSLKRYARDCLEVDANGVVVGAKMRLLDYMREEAEAYGVARSNTPSKQEKQPSKKQSKAKMDAAADEPGGTSPSTGKKSAEDDPFLAGFNDPYGRHTPSNTHKWANA